MIMKSVIIDKEITPHTNSSQRVRGKYREGATREQVEREVEGCWGGRFEKFENGEFDYVAYTD